MTSHPRRSERWLTLAPSLGLAGLCLLALPAYAQRDVDALMAEVLERREENRVALEAYVLDEREVFDVRGPGGRVLQGMEREYIWYARDGYLIRSPVRFDGTPVPEAERRQFEDDWLRQEQRRHIGQQRQPQSLSRRSAYDNVTDGIERLWGRGVSRELTRAITDDARLWRDGLAAIVAATDRILDDLGGIDDVGFGPAVARVRDGYVMLETERLDRIEVERLMVALLPTLAAAVDEAPVDDLAGFTELVELAATFELILSPEVAAALDRAQAVLRARGLADPAGALGVAIASLSDRPRGASADGTRVAPGDGPGADLQPRFMSEALFFEFEFEPGNYYVAGREQLSGRDVVRIEYYPEQLFARETEESSARGREIEEGFSKTSLVTLWVDVDDAQIVKLTFDNVGFEFLPMRWLVRLDDLRASMVMGQPIDGVWLPERVELTGRMTLATGSFDVTYARIFSDYRQADVRSRIRSYGPPRD